VEGALCDLQNLANQIDPSAFDACTGKVNLAPTNCTQNLCHNGNCDPNLGNVIAQCSAGADAPPVNISSGPGGTIATVTDGADANGNITVMQCMCPAPMTVHHRRRGFEGRHPIRADAACRLSEPALSCRSLPPD
jgi:hypothetical protein